MTRKVVVRRAAATAAMLAVFAVLALWVGPMLRHRPAAPQPGDVSLLLVELADRTERCRADARCRLVRVTFRDGRMLPPEPLWEDRSWFLNSLAVTCSRLWKLGEPDPLQEDTDCWANCSGPYYQVIDNRFVVGPRGGVFDAAEGRVIHRGSGVRIEVDGSTVVHGRMTHPGWSDVTAFDLKTRRAERRDDPMYRLPGVRSPGGAMSVEVVGSEITLHRPGQPPRPLGGGFRVGLDRFSSDPGRAPVLWLDDGRFLTQLRNGELVAVSLDGGREPVVSIPVGRELISSPHLHRDRAGRVIYSCDTRAYVVDVAAGTWERCGWVPLGHGYEVAWDGKELRSEGVPFGGVHCWPHWPGRVAATEGYVALISGQGQHELRVWAATGEWFTIDTEGMPESLVGWVR